MVRAGCRDWMQTGTPEPIWEVGGPSVAGPLRVCSTRGREPGSADVCDCAAELLLQGWEWTWGKNRLQRRFFFFFLRGHKGVTWPEMPIGLL